MAALLMTSAPMLNCHFHNFKRLVVACVVERGVAPQVPILSSAPCWRCQRIKSARSKVQARVERVGGQSGGKISRLVFDYHSDLRPPRAFESTSNRCLSRALEDLN